MWGWLNSAVMTFPCLMRVGDWVWSMEFLLFWYFDDISCFLVMPFLVWRFDCGVNA